MQVALLPAPRPGTQDMQGIDHGSIILLPLLQDHAQALDDAIVLVTCACQESSGTCPGLGYPAAIFRI